MSLTLRQVKYFVATAEMGQVSQAAFQLSISQSAVTSAIKELETELGVALFFRTPTGMELTDPGRRFLYRAYAILSAVDDALKTAPAQSSVSGALDLVATYTVMGYFLPHHLQRFSQLHPKITLNIFELNRDAIEEGIIGGRYDLAVVLTSNVVNPEVCCETWFGSERRLWLCAKHPLLERPEVTLADVASEPFIMLTVDEAAFTAMRYWSQTPYLPDVKLRTSSVEAVRSMVANGAGVAILSDLVYRPWSLEGKRIETVKLQDPVPSMNVGLTWKRGSEMSPAMTAFRDYFRQIFLAPALPGMARSRAAPG